MNKQVTCKKTACDLYTFRLNDGWDWAKIAIEERPPTGGTFMATSSFGNCGHIWSSIGDISFKKFLSQLDFSYFMTKAWSSGPTDLFVAEDTITEIKKKILQRRRQRINGDTKERCRAWYNEAKNIEPYDDEQFFMCHFLDTDVFSNVYCSDFCYLPICKRPNPQCVAFWEEAYKALLDEFRKEGSI